MVNVLATLAAPVGVLEALDKRAAERKQTHEQLLAKAGIVQQDWDDLATALGGANAANLRKLLNVSHFALIVIEQTAPVPEGSDASHNGQITSRYGDLN